MNSRRIADWIKPSDDKEIFAQRVPKDCVELTHKPERLFKASVVVVCTWALIEAPLELGGAIRFTPLLSVVALKVLIGLIGTAAIANLRFARQVFTFICAASVLAIAPALPFEYTRCVAIALFSTLECLGKAACVAAFAISSMARDGVGPVLAQEGALPTTKQRVLHRERRPHAEARPG